MPRLVVHCRAVHAEVEVACPCTGHEIHAAIKAATGVDQFHTLTLVETGDVIHRDSTVYTLEDTCVVVPLEKLILWVFSLPHVRCRVLHVWPGDMPDLLTDPDIFPQGAFDGRGNPVERHEWTPGITQLHTLPPDQRVVPEDYEGEWWRGPHVCSCNLLEVGVECPSAWSPASLS